jgi:hypothetical protein
MQVEQVIRDNHQTVIEPIGDGAKEFRDDDTPYGKEKAGDK